MLETQADTWYVWLGLALASLLVAGTALQLVDRRGGGAERIARAIDQVAASSYQAVERIPLDATAVRVGSSRLAVRFDGGVAHATLAYGPVVAVGDGRLGRVLRGRGVETVFDDRAAFRSALHDRRTRNASWWPAPDALTVRRVSWGQLDATLVG